jgi:hypothetical protein
MLKIKARSKDYFEAKFLKMGYRIGPTDTRLISFSPSPPLNTLYSIRY